MKVRVRGVAFGPLQYRVEGDPPAYLHAYACNPRGSVATLRFADGAPPPGALRVRDAHVVIAEGLRAVYLDAGADPERATHAPLAELVAGDLPACGAIMLHASAVRAASGAALLIGPPSVGKTTFARHDRSRALAGNAVCVWSGSGGWRGAALPFASDPDPTLDAREEFSVAVIVELHRGAHPRFEWLAPLRATVAVMKCLAAPPFADPDRAVRAALALDLVARVGVASLAVTGDRADLGLLDESLNVSTVQ